MQDSEARIRELVEQIAKEPNTAKVAVLARELNLLLKARDSELDKDPSK